MQCRILPDSASGMQCAEGFVLYRALVGYGKGSSERKYTFDEVTSTSINE
jgi:hypothetical protein